MENVNDIDDLIAEYNEIKDHLTPEEKIEIEKVLGVYQPPFIEWVETEFYIPETNKPMSLDSFQKAALSEAMRKDEKGLFVYSTVLWGDIKKSAKTSIGAARGLYAALFSSYATVRIVGNDRDQAESRLYYYITRCLKLNLAMAEKYKAEINRLSTTFNNNSSIRCVAIDPEGEAGGQDMCIVWTELWGHRLAASLKMWTEMTLSPLLIGKAQKWAETYAGYRGQSPLLENLYDKCVCEPGEEVNQFGGRRISEEYPFYTDETGTIFCVWNHEPHAPWQTEEYYNQERANLQDNEFDRVHRNIMQDSTQKLLKNNSLEGCLAETAPITRQTLLYLASDAAYSKNMKNTYALIGVTYDPDTDIIEVVYEKTWQGSETHEVDLIEPEKIIRDLAEKKATVMVWAYDPYQLKRTAQSFENNSVIPTYEFTQQSKRLVADSALLDRIRTKGIRIPPGMEVISHLHNADIQYQQNRVRIVRRGGKLGGPIDLAVCLSMATYVAVSERDRFPRPVRYDVQTGGQRVRMVISDIRETPEGLPPDISANSLPKEIYDLERS